MNLSAGDAGVTRDRIHNLDLTKPGDWSFYQKIRRTFLITEEGLRLRAYDDATGRPITPGEPVRGNVTVGVGFNMSREKAWKEWSETFGGAVNFTAVFSGRRALTEQQALSLLEATLSKRNNELREAYGTSVWGKMRANERLAIESAYFNAPALVKYGTNFCRAIRKYYKTGEEGYLLKAVLELGEKSNRTGHRGLARRRLVEAIILNSTKCPLYSGPFDEPCPKRYFTAVLGETIIPRAVDGWAKPFIEEAAFYIWRTQLDDKVRDQHALLEGKIFPKDRLQHEYPGDDYGCRCSAVPLPFLITVQGLENQKPNVSI